MQPIGGAVLGGQSFLFKMKAIAYQNFLSSVFFSNSEKKIGYKMSDVNLEQNCFVHPKKILKMKNFDMQLP